MTEPVDFFDAHAVDQFRRELRIAPHAVRTLRNRLLKNFWADESALADFPAAESLGLHTLDLFRRRDSDIDGATKLIFKTSAGMLIESVLLRIATGRTTVCVSSQVGCAAACDFCATGKMGIARNLTSSEILDQVFRAGQLLALENRRLQNIVFMGMGEPLHNEANLCQAIDTLIAADHFNRSPASILVSTVGIVDALPRFAKRFPKVNLALSLHSANQQTRERIIPLAKKTHLTEIRETLLQVNGIQQREVMIEYLMLAGLNDSRDNANELIAWLEPLQVHVNLIPYNPIEDAPHLQGTSTEDIIAFADILKNAGLKTTIRYSLGSDIAAACGQLVRKENRQRARSSSITRAAEHNQES